MDENPIRYTYFWLRYRYFIWREKIARAKYYWKCKLGHHITYYQTHHFKKSWNEGEPFKHWLARKTVVPIMNCRRCGKRVNIGLEDEYFSGKKS